MRETTLELAYGGDKGYRSVVYVGRKNDKLEEMKNYSCYIDSIPELLDRLQVNVLSTNEVELHFYITKNSFKTFRDGRIKENFFAYKNIVIDIDFHSKQYSTTYKYTELHNLAGVLEKHFKELDLPMWNITHYTGNGIQLWWCLEQASYKMEWMYDLVQRRFTEEIEKVLGSSERFKEIEVDPCSKSKVGYMRLFNTYNPHAETETRAFIESSTRYELTDLHKAVTAGYEFKKVSKPGRQSSEGTAWDFMMIQDKRRIFLIEKYMKDRTAEGKTIEIKENRSLDLNFGLLIYYNAARYVYSKEEAVSKTESLNNKYIHLEQERLRNLFSYVDGEYKAGTGLKFTNRTVISCLGLTKDEEDKYNFHAFTGEWDWQKCKPHKTRDELRKQAREEKELRVITLYNSGLTQEQVAKEIGCTSKTVRSILSKYKINRKTEHIRQIRLLKAEKYKQKEVAETLGIGIATVKRYWNAVA